MTTATLWGVGVLLLPALAIAIDGFAGVYSRDRKYTIGNVRCDTFRLLVPIWGDIRYLTNVDELARYGRRVTLCTTGDETELFYAGLHRIARPAASRPGRPGGRPGTAWSATRSPPSPSRT